MALLSRVNLVFRKYQNLTPVPSCFFSSGGCSLAANVAVVLSGCGAYDGTEIHEATGILVHLSRSRTNVAVFAPDKDQMHVINHIDGEPTKGETRNILVESARIARGQIQSIKRLKTSMFDAVVFPGGFGAAKNLSSFAIDGAKMMVNEEVERVLKEFHSAKKPIGMCCISPILAAKVIKGCEITLGRNEEGNLWPCSSACSAALEMGAKHVDKYINVHVDKNNLIVTTPAFMYGHAHLHDVFDGVGLMVKSLLELIKK